jgi:Bifunctional DNA primase/polymerase, N-terminal
MGSPAPNQQLSVRDGHHIADAAHTYIRAGLEVIRLVPGTKDPFKNSHAYLDATTNPQQVAQWWNQHPKANIGIRPPAGVVVLDIDPRHGGDTELERMVRFRGQLPQTWTAHTGSGGFHMWYCVGELAEVRGKLCTGVDIKHHGNGYVVVPPSIHPNGQPYEWVTPPAGKPADAPRWLQLAIQPPVVHMRPFAVANDPRAGSGQYNLGCLVARIVKAPEGRRNTTLFGACKDALQQGDFDAFEADLIGAARAAGLPDSEITSTVRSARRAVS